jgi:hypothetical protein
LDDKVNDEPERVSRKKVADEEVVCSEKNELCRELDVEGQSETVREYETHD